MIKTKLPCWAKFIIVAVIIFMPYGSTSADILFLPHLNYRIAFPSPYKITFDLVVSKEFPTLLKQETTPESVSVQFHLSNLCPRLISLHHHPRPKAKILI